jgi:glycosyltransferase involved in cell wall biosynthesis
MANLTLHTKELLEAEGAAVELVRTNAPYRPAWIADYKGVRALFRLIPYAKALVACAGRVDVLHIMANSGWSWHLYAMPAIWIGRLRGVRVVVSYHGGEAEAFLERSGRLVRATLGKVDALTVPSGFLRDVFRRFGIEASILPNVVDLARFFPVERERAAPRAAFRVLVARHLEPVYDIPTALRAFAALRARVPNAELVVAGSGPLRTELEQLARDLGVGASVCFTGQLDRDQMARAYRDADAVLNSSSVDNAPISILEAMASGTPVVSTRVGGVGYLVTDEVTALLAPVGDADALAAALARIAAEQPLAARLRANGIDAAQHYGWPHVRDVLRGVYAGTRRSPGSIVGSVR